MTTERLGRLTRLAAVGLALVVAAMAVTGWVIVAANRGADGGRPLSIAVLNDTTATVTLQPCARYFCDSFKTVDVDSGSTHTWSTNDSGKGIHSFVVEVASNEQILGCLAQRGIAGRGSATIRVSQLQECMT